MKIMTNPPNSKPDIWAFFDFDQTAIKGYKDSNGKPYVRENGKPFFTGEVWAYVLRDENVIDTDGFVYMLEPWLKFANGEYTPGQTACETNKHYLEVVKGKKYSDLVCIAKRKLAPRAIRDPLLEITYALFKKHTKPKLGAVTNVYDEICQGFHDAGIILNDRELRICNKIKVINDKLSDAYEMDVSRGKSTPFLECLKKNNIPYEQIFCFGDSYPMDAWVKLGFYAYGVGPNESMRKFVELHDGKQFEYELSKRAFAKRLLLATNAMKGEKP
jgi:hypothetical protein